MSRKNSLRFICLSLISLFFFCAFFVHSSFSEEASLEKEKSGLIKDIETLGRGLEITRGCLERATTEIELRQCREEEKVRQYYEVIDKLSEIGMSVEERRSKRLGRR